MLALSRPKLITMIEEAMKAKAPRMYRELKASGALEEELEDRANLALEIQEEAESRPLTHLVKNPKKDPLEQIAEARKATSQAWEQALAVALEFPEEDETA